MADYKTLSGRRIIRTNVLHLDADGCARRVDCKMRVTDQNQRLNSESDATYEKRQETFRFAYLKLEKQTKQTTGDEKEDENDAAVAGAFKMK